MDLLVDGVGGGVGVGFWVGAERCGGYFGAEMKGKDGKGGGKEEGDDEVERRSR